MKYRYLDVDGRGQGKYADYGPRPAAGQPPSITYANRPHCDMCGPFRGRYLRRMLDGEYRCFGCDRE